MSNQENCNDGFTQICVSGFDGKQEENGYQKLPNGLILQWGIIKPEDIGDYKIPQDVLFSIEFPNSCFMVNFDMAEKDDRQHPTVVAWIVEGSRTKRGFTFSQTFQGQAAKKPLVYFAIGN